MLLTVARLGHFGAAAEVLGTARTTVARRITALDRALGGPTLARTAHGWELTDLGRRARRAAEEIQRSLGSLAEAAPVPEVRGTLRIGAPEGLGAALVTPALVRLHRRHPDLAVQVTTLLQPVARRYPGLDLAVAVGRGSPSPGGPGLLLGEYRLALFAHRDYLRENGEPRSRDDLRHHDFVTYVETQLAVPELGRRGSGLPRPRSEFQASGVFAQLSAVRHGAGIALLPTFLVGPSGAEGELVPVPAGGVSHRVPIRAHVHPEAARRPAVRAALDALSRAVAARADVFPGLSPW
ncbi:LysR family transcriptional regulator [Kineococcus gynurae]|uniref:LysR family transcriptional regulator n=1 Tax=Kineococcus gynurae TaxID=452979 RepID=A0ABV5LV38_9ACTN